MSMPSVYNWFAENGNIGVDIFAVIVPTVLAIAFSLLMKKIMERSPLLMEVVFNKKQKS